MASHVFVWTWDQDIAFEDPEYDLNRAFHGVHLHAAVAASIQSNLSVDAVQTLGSITDLYHFKYEEGGLKQEGAMVQIGWHAQWANTAGGVFYDQVEINSTRNKLKHL